MDGFSAKALGCAAAAYACYRAGQLAAAPAAAPDAAAAAAPRLRRTFKPTAQDALSARLGEIKVVPVVALDDAKDAAPLAQALAAGGIPCAEITFRTAAALDSIKNVAALNLPGFVLGAGTVLSVEQAVLAVDAGADFIVCPGLNEEVVQFCLDHNVPVFPGAVTPTEVDRAQRMGIKVCKFFPASCFGGLATIESIGAPYTAMKFMPTGGINTSNLKAYLASPKVVGCGGSWMVKPAMVRAGQFEEITALAAAAIAITEA